DQYLMTILRRETVDTSVAQAVLNTLRPIIVPWGNQYLAGIAPSGAFAKGTAIKSGTDIDLFISLKPETRETLKESTIRCTSACRRRVLARMCRTCRSMCA